MRSHNKVRGFSLVEMMVAVVIGLIGTLVIFQVYAVSEGQKRSTVSGGDAQQNGAIALFTMERELRNAGHGLTYLIARGEPIYGWNNLTGAARPALVMRPLTIIPGPTSDSIDVNYSTFEGLTSPVAVTSPAGWNPASVAPANALQIAATAGFNSGNKIVVCPPEVDPLGPVPGSADNTCILAEITGFGVDPALPNQVLLAAPPTTFSVNGGALETSKFNPAAGFSVLNATLALDSKTLPAFYSPGAQASDDAIVFNLGNSFVARRYSVDVANSRLMVDDGGGAQEFADGVIAIRAQYGLDTTAVPDGVVDVWVNPRSVPGNALADNTPNDPAFNVTSTATIAQGWQRVQAIRVAVVTRSGLFEKDEVETRSSIPLWTNPTGNPAPAPQFAVPSGNARHYRYKVFESIVPLRNMIWGVHRTTRK
jgi:type IV pilus assembly protein PilW